MAASIVSCTDRKQAHPNGWALFFLKAAGIKAAAGRLFAVRRMGK